jgi:DNA-binding MarR family transcriptional regulator
MNNLTRYKLCAGLHVPPVAKLLYCYLLDISDNHYSVVVSVKNLARGLGLSRSAVSRNLHRLRQMDMIGIVSRYSDDGGRLSNKYIFM